MDAASKIVPFLKKEILPENKWYDYETFWSCSPKSIPFDEITGQNHANIQCDMEKLVPEMLGADKSEAEMELTLEMLVRAYDPCISCSTHYLDVTFKK